MIPLAMVVGDELSQSPPKVPFAERDDSIQALPFHRPDKPFRLRVAVRRTRPCSDDANARRSEPVLSHSTIERHWRILRVASLGSCW